MSRGTCTDGRAAQMDSRARRQRERCDEPIVQGTFFCATHLALAMARVQTVKPKRYVVLSRINGIPVGA